MKWNNVYKLCQRHHALVEIVPNFVLAYVVMIIRNTPFFIEFESSISLLSGSCTNR